jgi:hypothetical protein
MQSIKQGFAAKFVMPGHRQATATRPFPALAARAGPLAVSISVIAEGFIKIHFLSYSVFLLPPLAMIDIGKEAPDQTSLDADSKIANGVDGNQECPGESGEKDIDWSWHRTCSW